MCGVVVFFCYLEPSVLSDDRGVHRLYGDVLRVQAEALNKALQKKGNDNV